MDEDKVLTSAVIYLLDGKEVDAAKVLSACSLGYRVTNFYFQLGGEDKADSVLIDLACPRVVYEILQNNTNPIREAIVAAIEACLPTNYIFENLIAHVEYIDLAPGLLSELMTIADGKDADMELSADQRLYLQTIFDYFHEYGKWPTYRYVDRKLTQIRRDLDIEEIPKSLPLGFATAFAFNHDLNADAVLSVSAIYVCGGSEEDLEDFVKTLIFCVARYFSAEEDAVEISSVKYLVY